MKREFDLVVLGGGPGGIAAAKAAALKGMRVALINEGHLMGYGLEGAFKSKSLYEISRAHLAVHHRWGFSGEEREVDFCAIHAANEAGAEGLRAVHAQQLLDMGIVLIQGRGVFEDPHTLLVGETRVSGDFIIISTGTRPRVLPGMDLVSGRILTSDEVVDLDCSISSLLILGAGVIGCEFASIFSALGTKVTLIDTKPRIFSHDDEDISLLLQDCFEKGGVEVVPSGRCQGMKVVDGQVHTDLGEGGVRVTDAGLLSVGRVPNTTGIGLDEIGVRRNDWGYILTTDNMQTNIPHIYSVGDLGLRDNEHDLSLVHVAEAEGRAAVDHIVGKEEPLSTEYVPFIIFTHPMIAGSGCCEHEARKKYGDVRVGKWCHIRNHRAHAMSSQRGFVKLIVGPVGDDRVLGVRAIGDGVDSVVGEVSVMIQYKLPYTYLLNTTHAHPSFSESLQGAAQIIAHRALAYQEGEEYAHHLY